MPCGIKSPVAAAVRVREDRFSLWILDASDREIWEVDPPREPEDPDTLLSGTNHGALPNMRSPAGMDFRGTNLWVVTSHGHVWEIPDATNPGVGRLLGKLPKEAANITSMAVREEPE